MTQKDTPSKTSLCQNRNGRDGAVGEGREGDEEWIWEGQQMRCCLDSRIIFCKVVDITLGKQSWAQRMGFEKVWGVLQLRSRLRCKKIKFAERSNCRRNGSYCRYNKTERVLGITCAMNLFWLWALQTIQQFPDLFMSYLTIVCASVLTIPTSCYSLSKPTAKIEN